jgi:hypothetical protein
MLITARSSHDFAYCLRATASAALGSGLVIRANRPAHASRPTEFNAIPNAT